LILEAQKSEAKGQVLACKISLSWEDDISFVRLLTGERRWETPRFRYLHQYHMTVMIELFFTSLLLILRDMGGHLHLRDMNRTGTWWTRRVKGISDADMEVCSQEHELGRCVLWYELDTSKVNFFRTNQHIVVSTYVRFEGFLTRS
jgi:hypothetical protein